MFITEQMAFSVYGNGAVFVITTRETKKLQRQKKCTDFSTLKQVGQYISHVCFKTVKHVPITADK